jgi:hypothetical protein
MQPQAGDFRAANVTFFGAEFAICLHLEVCGLDFEQKHVEQAAVAVWNDIKICSEAEEGEQVERFF